MKDYLNFEGLSYFLNKLFDRFNQKVDKVDGKGLSTNDYTDEEKAKLFNIEGLPEVTIENNDDILQVVDGAWAIQSPATDEEIVEVMLEMDMMPIVQDADGTILVDNDNTIILA